MHELTDDAIDAWTRVLLPSMSFPPDQLATIPGIQHYEERFFVLALAHAEHGRVVYVTSTPIADEILDYYCSLAPDPERTRRRITLVSLDDPAPCALSEKLAGRPDVLDRIRQAAGAEAYLYPFHVTHREAPVAEALGLRVFGPPQHAVHLGSKTGSRRVSRRAGAGVPTGVEDLWSFGEIEEAIAAMPPEVAAVVVKFNEGFSGMGNVILERAAIRTPITSSPALFCAAGMTWDAYGAKVATQGAIVEELLSAPGLASPSVQVLVSPSGRPEVASTHDQVLGDPRNQVYLGCRFPADDAYRATITAHARAIAEVLAAEGVIGPFGVDFVVVPDGGAFVSEVNLRMGGTTHPFAIARFVTDGTYDHATGRLVGSDGREKLYVGTDNISSERLRGRRPDEVVTALAREGVLFDRAGGTGVTVHMLGALAEFGKMGSVCVADSRQEADDLSRATVRILTG